MSHDFTFNGASVPQKEVVHETKGLYERIPLFFVSVAVLVCLSNSSHVASALPIYDYD